MSWFHTLTGFTEESPDQVRNNISLDSEILTSLINGREMVCGRLEIPSLAELRQMLQAQEHQSGKISVRENIANVQDLHMDEANAGALFQVASQFNLLEMMSHRNTPELGVGIYGSDPTQGPACAIAAGAGTIYRNYFVPVNGQIGQSTDNQIDCLADLGNKLGNTSNSLWEMQNGYALASLNGLKVIVEKIRAADENEIDAMRGLLRIGVQWNTEVTLNDADHLVTQAYCSALPIAYTSHSPDKWEEFARLVLDASYEATFCAAILNMLNTGNNRVYLTLVGGGVFGNNLDWITDSIRRAVRLYDDWSLNVVIVSYNRSKPEIQQLVNELNS